MLGHPDLKIDCKNLGPLLEPFVVESLLKQYLQNMETNYTEWLKKALETEFNDWKQVLFRNCATPETETELL